MTQTEQDVRILVKLLYQNANWSFSRIARVAKALGQSRNSVKAIYDKALEEQKYDIGTDFPKSERHIDLRYVGDTSDIEYLEGHIYHNVCGGGRKANESEESKG